MKKIILLIAALLCSNISLSAPSDFSDAKKELRTYVYHDQNKVGTFYCGCQWKWAGASGGRVDLNSCGYQTRSQPTRANRIEWEHIVPASSFGRARQCWQHGGRDNCQKTDLVFNSMEADMHNLTPSIGEVNADRSNFNYGQLGKSSAQYGACKFKVDFEGRTAEPRDEVKGWVARVYFYMSDRYALPLSRQQQQLFTAWNRQHPVTDQERLIDNRIAQRMGHHNPFVTGEKQWVVSGKPVDVLQVSEMRDEPVPTQATTGSPFDNQAITGSPVRGNKRSNIYHLSSGCPGFDQMSKSNIVEFKNEASAIAAGFRKAKNCHKY